MDVKLFLEGQAKWEMDSPHHLMMLHKMFQHASEQGQKEAERMVCQGHQHKLPKLNPESDIPAVQLVGPILIGRRLSPYAMKCINSRHYQGLHLESQKLWQRWCPP